MREYSYLLRHRSFDMRLVAIVKLLSNLYVHLVLMAVLLAVLGVAKYVPIGLNTLVIFYYLLASIVLLVS